MPQSAVMEIRHIMAHILDAFDWFGVVTARLKNHLPRTRAQQG